MYEVAARSILRNLAVQSTGVFVLAGAIHIALFFSGSSGEVKFAAMELVLGLGSLWFGRATGLGLKKVRRWWVLAAVLLIQVAPFVAVECLTHLDGDAALSQNSFVSKIVIMLTTQLFGVFCIVILDPLAEEMMFRGWIWEGVLKACGENIACGVTAIAFLLPHASSVRNIVATIYITILLTITRRFTGSLFASIAVHSFGNLLAVSAGKWPFSQV